MTADPNKLQEFINRGLEAWIQLRYEEGDKQEEMKAFNERLVEERTARVANMSECFFCREEEDKHISFYLCTVCYSKQPLEEEMQTGCLVMGCSCCKKCLQNNITSQFDRNTNMETFRCICQQGEIPESVIKGAVDDKEYKRLTRIRLSRRIDANPNMLWCPHLGCEKECERQGKDMKVECTYCGNHACFKCQQPWHEGRKCNDQHTGAYKCFTWTNDVRRCPNSQCRVMIEKNDGCPHMSCQRCNFQFCWCCMGNLSDSHNTWYNICPELPFSQCGNLIVTILFLIFLPVCITVGPLISILIYSMFLAPYEVARRLPCCCGLVFWLLCIIILMPLAVAFGMVAVAIFDVFAILPLYFYTINYLVRLLVAICRSKL